MYGDMFVKAGMLMAMHLTPTPIPGDLPREVDSLEFNLNDSLSMLQKGQLRVVQEQAREEIPAAISYFRNGDRVSAWMTCVDAADSFRPNELCIQELLKYDDMGPSFECESDEDCTEIVDMMDVVLGNNNYGLNEVNGD